MCIRYVRKHMDILFSLGFWVAITPHYISENVPQSIHKMELLTLLVSSISDMEHILSNSILRAGFVAVESMLSHGSAYRRTHPSIAFHPWNVPLLLVSV